MHLFQTIALNVGIYAGSLLWTFAGILVSPLAYTWYRLKGLPQQQAMRRLIWIYGYVWTRFLGLFIPVELPKQELPEPCVLVINHTSFFDTYLIGAQPIWDLCLSVRNWPYKIPFYKPFMLAADYVQTEAWDADQIISHATQAIKEGATVVFYPEGTRSATGKLGRFKSGAFKIAMEANVPVVPMCISGAHKLLPKGSRLLQFAPIKVSLLPAVYPDKYHELINGHVAMRKDVKVAMAEALLEPVTDPDNRSRR